MLNNEFVPSMKEAEVKNDIKYVVKGNALKRWSDEKKTK